MKSLVISFVIFTSFLSISCNAKSGKQISSGKEAKVTFMDNDLQKSVDVLVDGELFTTFRWPDNLCKPVLFPIYTSAGTEITRGFPIHPKMGERADHPHQTGMWLTYGNVDGNDFWGNGSQGLGTINAKGGTIKHIRVDKKLNGNGEGVLTTSESWVDSTGVELLKEHTEYHFIAEDSIRIIERITTLTAVNKDVSMPDTKEGMFAIRVARQLELPSEGDITLYNAEGHPETVKAMINDDISGNYKSSEGNTGESVWGTRARWMNLYGEIGAEKISLVICDHPKNLNYPTYWHARGYGLFSANPLGVKDFTEGKDKMNLVVQAGKSITFRYRVIISSGKHLTDAEINNYSDDFTHKY